MVSTLPVTKSFVAQRQSMSFFRVARSSLISFSWTRVSFFNSVMSPLGFASDQKPLLTAISAVRPRPTMIQMFELLPLRSAISCAQLLDFRDGTRVERLVDLHQHVLLGDV